MTREKLEAIRAQQARAVQAYEQAVQLSLQRYTDGKAAYFEVLQAQRIGIYLIRSASHATW